MLNDTNSLPSKVLSSFLNNANAKHCLVKYSLTSCFFTEFSGIIGQFILAFSLFPQIIYFCYFPTRYIAGISYSSIIIRIVALILLITADTIKWPWIIVLIATIIIFIFIIYGLSSRQESKFILITISLIIWIISSGVVIHFRKQKDSLKTIGYALLAVHMLPQLFLNSLLQTAKGLLKITILLFAISDLLRFINSCTHYVPIINLISIYYSFSFFLLIYFQSMNYIDEPIYIISRTKHTYRKPDDNSSTNKTQSSEQKVPFKRPVSLSTTDSVATNESSISEEKQSVWYLVFGSIFCIVIAFTILFLYRAWTSWIICIPISIPVILYILFLLRTKLDASKIKHLTKIL